MSKVRLFACIDFGSGVYPCGSGLIQFLATGVSARTTMKGAAKCDKHCELQNSANQQLFERVLHFRVIPESIPASVSIVLYC